MPAGRCASDIQAGIVALFSLWPNRPAAAWRICLPDPCPASRSRVGASICSSSRAGTAALCRKPCASLQRNARRPASCSAVSTPSATVMRSKAEASSTMLATRVTLAASGAGHLQLAICPGERSLGVGLPPGTREALVRRTHHRRVQAPAMCLEPTTVSAPHGKAAAKERPLTSPRRCRTVTQFALLSSRNPSMLCGSTCSS